MSLLDHVNLHFVDSYDKTREFMEWVKRPREIMGVDTETSGLKPYNGNRVRLIQFGDENDGWAIPWEQWSGLVKEVLTVYTGDLVLHNSKFDIAFIELYLGVSWPWHRTHDTMAMAHLADPLRPKGLKPLAAKHVDSKAVAGQKMLDHGMKDNKWTWETVPLDYTPYWLYAALDPVLTVYVYKHFKYVLDRYREAYDLEMATTAAAMRMERRGARVDLDYCRERMNTLTDWCDRSRTWLMNEYGLKKLTNATMLKYFVDNSVPMLHKKTASGAQSMDKEVLESIKHPLAETMLNIRKAEKMVGPYFSNFIDLADSNNRLHPNIFTMGTRTARMSITEPALQTLPRRDPTVRNAFIPSEGNALVSVDADQIEARLMAHFSRDQGLISAFNSPTDFFCAIASTIFNEDIQKGDSRRDLTKGVVYGKLYGAGTETMSRTAKVDFETMSNVVQMFDSRFSGVKRLQRQIGDIAAIRHRDEGRAYVKTPTGRRLISDDNMDYTLVNYLIQSHAAEILKQNIVKLELALDASCLMILPVHDELVFDVPADEADDVLKFIEDTMTDTETYEVPITWSGDIMRRAWGEKYE